MGKDDLENATCINKPHPCVDEAGRGNFKALFGASKISDGRDVSGETGAPRAHLKCIIALR